MRTIEVSAGNRRGRRFALPPSRLRVDSQATESGRLHISVIVSALTSMRRFQHTLMLGSFRR
jgi:hypothetical protein